MTRPPRFAIDSPPSLEGLATIAGPELHHLRDVARLGPGDHAVLIDREGREHLATIIRYERDSAVAQVRDLIATGPPRSSLILAQAIIRGARMDFIVEKAAELGATELWPFTSARTVSHGAGAQKIARWRRLAVAACKQSLLAPPMAIREVRAFLDLIPARARDTLAVVCAEGAEPLSLLLEREQPRALLIACGPEGDFDSVELDAAASAGFVRAGLGPGRLRSETAALSALAISSEWLTRETWRTTER